MKTTHTQVRVFVVIVNWNGKNDTLTCLSSLLSINKEKVRLHVIVVDNGSTDDSVRGIQEKHPWVKMLTTGENLGFTGGNNAGIRYALREGADYIWLLNNDTIVDKDALSILRAFEDPGAGIAGSKIYFAPGKEYHKDRYSQSERGKVFWYAGGIIDWANMYASHRGVDAVDEGQYDRLEQTPFITGCSMMARRGVFEKIGVLDDRLYLYLEDVDICLRAKRHGFSLWYVPSSIVWHVNAGSSGGAGNPLQDYYITRNRLLVGFRWAPIRTKAALLREAVRMLSGPHPIKRKAVLDAFLGKWGKQYEPKKHKN
ncbi:glycosyltransferase family 2 protein [Patescibacteria group bacterium]|nr:glycosyltransferase family 2 protein [Patescibacteria group bacterium]MBU1472747.1 glycosyltransferase family 2 protein [Patescibacteria group bacterium]MBU2460014.1 glycosyltransferase family 2 protein [Patescibacteria group bacterium]MBU2544328.1 glycosyltransferase family 2 protein [Patescibacteria group bacterium]